jgi:FkbM family methyltransferase
MNPSLFTNVSAAELPIAHACEIGVYLPDTSNVLGWIERGVRTTLVECDPLIVTALTTRFGALPHVHIEPVAVADESGSLTLYRTGASTFGSNVPDAPALTNDRYQRSDADAFTVRAVTFDTIDDGQIDVLSIDIEGGEWFVLKHLQSRPAVISVETHGKHYVNPFMREIDGWMQRNGYGAWYADACDTVYRREWTRPMEDRRPKDGWFKRFKRAVRGR